MDDITNNETGGSCAAQLHPDSPYGKIKVLFEDNHLLVVNKPAGLLSQSDQTRDPDLQNILKIHLKEKYQKPGNVFLALVQRLDRGTGGVMVLAKTSKAAARLSEQIRSHQPQKHYLAVVCSAQVKQRELVHYLEKDRNRKKAMVSSQHEGKGQKSVLDLRPIQTVGNLTLISVHLKTGRFHQIRAQLSAEGMPLHGDRKYGAPPSSSTNPALFCRRISFRHPTRDDLLHFEAHPPSIQPWSRFNLSDLKQSP
ncbi:RluA family pseudouridine synthase [Balneolales bacterium ANBcel1]|nr:RluA family pseudouridine synthase [Balneolales bacterium ANBcel1]